MSERFLKKKKKRYNPDFEVTNNSNENKLGVEGLVIVAAR